MTLADKLKFFLGNVYVFEHTSTSICRKKKTWKQKNFIFEDARHIIIHKRKYSK